MIYEIAPVVKWISRDASDVEFRVRALAGAPILLTILLALASPVGYNWKYMRPLTELKNQAAKLRRKGLSYGEIGKEISVSKSSLSLWLKGIRLNSEHRKRLYTKQIIILAKGPNSQKERRARQVEYIVNEAKKEVTLPLSSESLKLMGAMLYWAEGRKMKGGMELTNSDPLLILFFVNWLDKVFSIPAKNLRMRLNIYSQQEEIKVKKFWSELTGIPLDNFRKSFIKPANKFFKKNTLYYGTARIEVPKSVDKKHKLHGWIHKALNELHPTVESIERKWTSLKEIKRPVNIYIRP